MVMLAAAPVGLEGQAKLGPYESWMFDAGKFFDLPLLMLEDEATLSAVAEFEQPVDPCALTPGDNGDLQVRIPSIGKLGTSKTRFVPLLLTAIQGSRRRNLLREIGAQDVQGLIVDLIASGKIGAQPAGKIRFNLPVRQLTLNPAAQPAPSPIDRSGASRKPKAIVAIIDQGIPFAHARFRQADGQGTRIDHCWIQSAPSAPGSDLHFGREVTSTQIDQWITDLHGDEDAIYGAAHALGVGDIMPVALAGKYSHGGHVLDSLTGLDTDDIRIIAVDLPSSATWETSGFGTDMFILSAMQFIFDRARVIAESYGIADPLPLVVNLSYGISGGPHDGSGLLEAAFEEMVADRNSRAPTSLVMPSGNMFQDQLFARLTDQHFIDQGDGSKQAELQWLIPAEDRTSTYLELWYPPGTRPEDVQVSVLPPGAGLPANGPLAAKGSDYREANITVQRDANTQIVGQFSIDLHRNTRWRAMVILAPTELSFAPTAPTLPDDIGAPPSGVWTLRIRVPATMTFDAADHGVDCRIQQDISFAQSRTGAKQSYFYDPLYCPYGADGALDSTDHLADGTRIRRFGAVNGLATSASTIVVGGYCDMTAKAAAYSSAGPQSTGTAGAVDLSARTERTIWHRGVVAAGTRSGTSVAQSGTSSAAPMVARSLAESFARQGQAAARTKPAQIATLSAYSTQVTELRDPTSSVQRLGAMMLKAAT